MPQRGEMFREQKEDSDDASRRTRRPGHDIDSQPHASAQRNGPGKRRSVDRALLAFDRDEPNRSRCCLVPEARFARDSI